MKRLNKITLILVAVMGIMISGCGSDMKKAPFVSIIVDENEISLYYHYEPTNFKTWEEYDKEVDEWYVNTKKNPPKLISLKGRRDCSKLPVKWNNTYYITTIKSIKDCPPKDRLNNKSYEFTIKTNYGTFKYDTSDKSTKSTKTKYGYLPIK